MSGRQTFGEATRDQFLLEPDVTYLNHGSFGATPRRVLDAQIRWLERAERQPVRFMVREVPPLLRSAADRVGAYAGAPGDEVAFVTNATTGVNAALRSLSLRRGDRIVTTAHVYPAVRNALRFVADRAGAELVEIPIPLPTSGPDEILQRIERGLEGGAALALFDHICSASALVFPAAEIVTACRARGIPVFIDGAHALGMLPLDLRALGADWYTANAHKWLCAAKGCAILHARAERWPALKPTVISHETEGVGAFDWPGTRDFSAWLSVTEALDWRDELGDDRVRAHNRGLALETSAALADAWGTELAGPDSVTGSMRSIRAPGRWEGTLDEAAALHDWLWERHRIEVPVIAFGGEIWIRISAQIYNTPSDYRLLELAIRDR